MPFTADQATELQQNPAWKDMVEEMNNIIKAEMEKMIFAEDENDMVRLQERVKALRFTTRFPEIVVDRESVDDPKIITGD